MNVKNRKCIRHLSFRSLMASRKRNLIAISAIILTTLLFTTLFTIVLSLNASYETYQFRQIGGYCHGTFKDVTEEQAAAIAAHANVKETGVRRMIGVCSDGVFAKLPAEVSFMDENCTRWSYAQPQIGRLPESGMEVTMDTAALNKLGITPKLGAQVQLTYSVKDKDQGECFEQTDTFTLVGYWDYDSLMPVHYINISREYADKIVKKAMDAGMGDFRTDLNVMMASAVDIRGQMEQVDTELGYTWESYGGENNVRIGVNWGYTTSQLKSHVDPEMLLAMTAFILLVVFTGYLIIYNIFQISVTSDIRFYGLLKTIGTTPRQIRRIIRQQALALAVAGIPIGMLAGYGVGALLVPVVLANGTIISASSVMVSASPLIFAGSALFSLLTVLVSCTRPGRIAAKVSPVEAAKYTETSHTTRKARATRGARVHQMAFANLGRSRSKTILVVVSLALSVTLLNELYSFVGGFDMEKYTSKQISADFIVSGTPYFRFERAQEYIPEEMIREIQGNTEASLAGCAYEYSGGVLVGMSEEALRGQYQQFFADEAMLEQIIAGKERRNGLLLGDVRIEGMDTRLLEKLSVVEGDLAPLYDAGSNAIAVNVRVDDYGNVMNQELYPKAGDKLTINYVEEAYYIDSRTGEPCTEDTPEEYLKWHIENVKEVEYTVCALVVVPHSLSFRRYVVGAYDVVLNVGRLVADSGQPAIPLFYMFDTPDVEAEAAAEVYLSDLTAGDLSPVMYESKETVRSEFKQFQKLFLLLGGLLCAVIGMVGALNFFNAIMTGIISRRREFAVLQSVGMTNRQLRFMLIYEGMFYALGSVVVALFLAVIIGPLAGNMMNTIFWFYEYHFTITPVLAVIPVFVLLGWLIPAVLYGQTNKQSVVERLREE